MRAKRSHNKGWGCKFLLYLYNVDTRLIIFYYSHEISAIIVQVKSSVTKCNLESYLEMGSDG